MSGNPYDSGKDFGINHDNKFIPFKSEVSTVFSITFLQKGAEINTFPHTVLTDS